jgi:putative transposase
MEIRQGFRFRARPSAAQAQLFARTAGCCRLLYNTALEHRSTNYAQWRRRLNYAAQAREFTAVPARKPRP